MIRVFWKIFRFFLFNHIQPFCGPAGAYSYSSENFQIWIRIRIWTQIKINVVQIVFLKEILKKVFTFSIQIHIQIQTKNLNLSLNSERNFKKIWRFCSNSFLNLNSDLKNLRNNLKYLKQLKAVWKVSKRYQTFWVSALILQTRYIHIFKYEGIQHSDFLILGK